MRKHHRKDSNKATKVSAPESLPRFSAVTGILFQQDSRKLIIKEPDPATKLDLNEVLIRAGERGFERVARWRGQSGIKWNTNHTLFIKDLKGKTRIECKKVGSEWVNIDGVDHRVPAFQPIKMLNK